MPRSFVIRLLLSFYLLKVLVPAGYMPVDLSLGQGWMQLCPSELTPQQMAWLHGKPAQKNDLSDVSHHEHHSAHQHHSASDSQITNAHDHSTWSNDCDFGSLNAGITDALFQQVHLISTTALQEWRSNLAVASAILAARRRQQMQRAPPFMF